MSTNMSAIAPEAVTPLPGSAAAAVAFRTRGQLHITVIAKATFAFAHDAKMPRTRAPQAILHADVYHGNNPARSVRFTSDLAPYLGRADVLFTGDACAPAETPVRSLPVRLAIVDRDRPVLDKRLLVQDRSGFLRMPIVYERTWSGPDFQDNPLGIDAGGQPNIIDPARPMRPAGFGPIARAWPPRKRLLGSTPRKALEGAIAEIPPDFDGTYFQAAPPDQRIDVVRGDEWIVLEGLHPSLPRLWTRLPEARGKARVFGISAFGVSEGQPLDLSADTLRIDGEEQCCTVVWRRSFPVSSEDALTAVRIVAGVELAGEKIDWPAPAVETRVRLAPKPAAVLGPTGTLLISDAPVDTLKLSAEARTITLGPEQDKGAQERQALPFQERPAPAALSPMGDRPIPGAPWSGEPAAPVPAPNGGLVTMALAGDVPERVAADDITLDECAAIAVELAERRTSQAEVLGRHGLSEACWTDAEKRWDLAMKEEAAKGDERALRDAYDAAYIAAWRGIRGPFEVADYAQVLVAAERGKLAPTLETLGIRRTVWMRLGRVFQRRIAEDRSLAENLERELAALRKAA